MTKKNSQGIFKAVGNVIASQIDLLILCKPSYSNEFEKINKNANK
ncbi:hypothetical protein THF1C08_20030 [Vibrio jasicida]|uniref:Uncharacterized protein n=1 Tax=Vibrio jasicida TaxID=766224 RepID=A0AAU9QLZ3_9VIBR|nr:hypothetical protein THF1C08_20030 [Vibrio jasicida]CAH1583997.1 hypothetical protein THF1A12_20030 [Vibrio jasicida]